MFSNCVFFSFHSYIIRNFIEIEIRHFHPLGIKGLSPIKVKHFSLTKVNFQISSHDNVDETSMFVKKIQICSMDIFQ